MVFGSDPKENSYPVRIIWGDERATTTSITVCHERNKFTIILQNSIIWKGRGRLFGCILASWGMERRSAAASALY